MSVRKAAAAAVAALVAATLALTAGCSTGGGEKNGAEAGGHSGRPRTSAPASPDKEPPPPKDDRERKRRPGKTATPMVPRASLTPATGSFTKKEKKYLTGRVPEGLEPAAVLEAGRTACARLRTTAAASRKDAVSALKAGEIDNAEPAVEHLCPKYKPLLKAAGKN
ncbi:hypothetical protein ITI46_25705 [Streptomyces oryzae]|uniref:DUF732 domain-containing protein n=1 Tax=Streptomyces oryzae TaxID=1434886 RepID=A0ABS3XJ56_9ACTN|nr:hypothetical protein [Streptomyces oryzae]MBO8195022.1 hypothetical protein [Streptomyces oryzae]